MLVAAVAVVPGKPALPLAWIAVMFSPDELAMLVAPIPFAPMTVASARAVPAVVVMFVGLPPFAIE